MKLLTLECGICRGEFLTHYEAGEVPICGHCEIELAEWRDADLIDLRNYAEAILPDPF